MRQLGWLLIAAVYLLTLSTQLPHVYDVYSALERETHLLFGLDTALGASVAFEASIAIFTARVILNRKSERSRWTEPGIIAFLLLSALANLSYYFDLRLVDSVIMPAALVVAIPLALWLYAQEFSADAKAAIRAAQRQRKSEPTATVKTQEEPQQRHRATCACGWTGKSEGYATPAAAQNALNAHKRRCSGFSDNGAKERQLETRGK